MRQSAVLSIAVLLLAIGSASAAPILTVDQQNLAGGVTSSPTISPDGFGQSFTPTLSAIDAVEVSIRLFSGGPAGTAQLQLFQGQGFGGTMLGSSANVSVSNTTFSLVHFDLLSSIALTPGSAYTLRVLVLSSAMVVELSQSNPYSGGVMLNDIGTVLSTSDLVFREGLHAAAVPEPASLTLLGLGLAGLGARRWRQRREK